MVVINNVEMSSASNQRVLGGPQDFHGVMEERGICSDRLVEIECPLEFRPSGGFTGWRESEGNASSRAFRCVIMTKSRSSAPIKGCIFNVKMIMAREGSLENGLSDRIYFGKVAVAVGFGSDRQETLVIR